MSRHILAEKISNGSVVVGVIGLGYVGLPLCIEFIESGINVVGFDIDSKKLNFIRQKTSYINDISSERLAASVDTGLLSVTDDFSRLLDIDAVSICVPTPLSKQKDPDMSYVKSALDQLVQYQKKGHLIILESTTYPGTTEEVILPRLEANGYKAGSDFFLAFSPERVDPGNKAYQTANTPKIIGGVTPECSKVCKSLYELVIQKVIAVSSPKTAELIKLLENTFRSVNIALANEMALICDKLGVDVWEVIHGASSKPFGFMPFFPGPGLGGHCIPIDPLYLSWKLKSLNYDARFIHLADDINSHMPHHVVNKVQFALNEQSKSVKGSRIVVLGVAYKKDIGDVRESPSVSIMSILNQLGASMSYMDPYVPSITIDNIKFDSLELDYSLLTMADVVLILTDHSQFSSKDVFEQSKFIVDTRNKMAGFQSDSIISI